jgi:hypothetical protein
MTRRRDERGFVVVLVALTMLVVLALTALVVDLGQGRQRRRSAQNAADAAALASVQELPDGPWDTAGATYVDENDFDATVADIERGDWDGDDFTANPDTGDCVRAITTETGDSMFGRVVGDDDITVRTSAVACLVRTSTGFPAIHAHDTVCESGIDMNVSGTITGGIHSNREIKLRAGGSNLEITGDSTYVNNVDINSNVDFVPDENNPRQVGVRDWPSGVFDRVDDHLPGGATSARYDAAVAAGVFWNFGSDDIDTNELRTHVPPLYNTSTRQIQPGIYVTTGEIDLPNDVTNAPGDPVKGIGATFISIGSGFDPTVPGGDLIKISGGEDIAAWRPNQSDPISAADLLMFSARNPGGGCNSDAIQLTGNSHEWAGLVFAPFGEVQMSGSGNLSIAGSIIAKTVDLAGSTVSITSVGEDVDVIDEFHLVD